MAKYLLSIFFLGSLLIGTHHSVAQNKNLEISDTLAANSEKLKVKMGTQWMGKIWKFKFGDYAVTDSKSGWVTTTTNKKFKRQRAPPTTYIKPVRDATRGRKLQDHKF